MREQTKAKKEAGGFSSLHLIAISPAFEKPVFRLRSNGSGRGATFFFLLPISKHWKMVVAFFPEFGKMEIEFSNLWEKEFL